VEQEGGNRAEIAQVQNAKEKQNRARCLRREVEERGKRLKNKVPVITKKPQFGNLCGRMVEVSVAKARKEESTIQVGSAAWSRLVGLSREGGRDKRR